MSQVAHTECPECGCVMRAGESCRECPLLAPELIEAELRRHLTLAWGSFEGAEDRLAAWKAAHPHPSDADILALLGHEFGLGGGGGAPGRPSYCHRGGANPWLAIGPMAHYPQNMKRGVWLKGRSLAQKFREVHGLGGQGRLL